jgi:AAA domain
MTVEPLKLKYFDECCNEPTKPWFIKGVIAQDEDSSWFGAPSAGKSTLLVDLAIHLATGRDWREFKTKMKAGVVIFALERAALTRRRIAAYGIRDGSKNLPIAVAGDIVDLIGADCVEIITATVKAAAERFGVPVGLIVIDTYSKGVAAGGGDEDKAQHANVVAANMKKIHEQIGAPVHIAMIGHTGKDETRGERGSNAKLGHVDLAVQISGNGDIKSATVTKGNDQPEGLLTSWEGETVEIGKDEDGDAITTYIVSQRTVQAPASTARMSDRLSAALTTLNRLIGAHGQNGAVTVERWREELFRSGVLDNNAKNPREAFRRVRVELLTAKRIVIQDDLIRIADAPIKLVPLFGKVPPPPGGNILPLPRALPPIPIR